MRTIVWVATVLVSILFLMALLPWLGSPEYRNSRRGGDSVMIMAVLAIILAVLIANLVTKHG